MTAQVEPKGRSRRASDREAVGQAATERARRVGTRSAPRLPQRYGQWTASVLVVLISVLGAGWFWQKRSDRVDVLVVTHSVAEGVVVSRTDLGLASVAGVGQAIAAADAQRVIGQVAAVGLVPGQVLTPGMVTSQPVPASGRRVVGVQVDGTRAPAGLQPGDQVSVVAVPPSGDASSPSVLASPTVLADAAQVLEVDVVDEVGSRIALVVPSAVADRVASFGAAGRVALVQAPLGGDR